MAKNENKDYGYCPYHEFLRRIERRQDISPCWEKTMGILGDRVLYMLYTKGGNVQMGEYDCYIVDALLGGTGILGIQIAAVLSHLIPTCIYSEKGCLIVCTDIINPIQLLSKAREENGRWTCIGTDKKTCSGQEAVSLHEDERYSIFVQEGDNEVRMFIYRK